MSEMSASLPELSYFDGPGRANLTRLAFKASGTSFVDTRVSEEWPKIKAAKKAADSFETPNVNIPTETRTIAGRQIRLAEAGPKDAPLVVLLSPFPESILSFAGCFALSVFARSSPPPSYGSWVARPSPFSCRRRSLVFS